MKLFANDINALLRENGRQLEADALSASPAIPPRFAKRIDSYFPVESLILCPRCSEPFSTRKWCHEVPDWPLFSKQLGHLALAWKDVLSREPYLFTFDLPLCQPFPTYLPWNLSHSLLYLRPRGEEIDSDLSEAILAHSTANAIVLAGRWKLHGSSRTRAREEAARRSCSLEEVKIECLSAGLLLAITARSNQTRIRIGDKWVKDEHGAPAECVPVDSIEAVAFLRWLAARAFHEAEAALNDPARHEGDQADHIDPEVLLSPNMTDEHPDACSELNRILDMASPQQCLLLKAHLETGSWAAAARRIGISEKQASVQVTRLREKLSRAC